MSIPILDEKIEKQEQPQIFPTVVRRFQAISVDMLLIMGVICLLPALSLSIEHGLLVTKLFLLFFPFYKIAIEGAIGYTLGKKLLGFKVVSIKSFLGDIGYLEAFGRNILWLLLSISSFQLFSLNSTDIELNPSRYIYLRELLIIGFFVVTNLCLFLSFLYFLKDNNKQTWMDNIVQVVCIKK